MHLIFATRGIYHSVDLFLDHLKTKYFLRKRINLKTGKEEIDAVQGALRPIQLWEYVFPEESLAEVQTMLNIGVAKWEEEIDGKVVKKESLGHKIDDKAIKVLLAPIRKAMGLLPIPDYNPVMNSKFVYNNSVSIYPLGIKKDKRKKWEEIGYEQEML